MKMKQMPYKIEDGMIERAKYRAKMAVRDVANPVEQPSRAVQWRWASVAAVAAVVVIGVVGLVKFYDLHPKYNSLMEELVAEMQSAPDELIADLSVDNSYYEEEDYSSL